MAKDSKVPAPGLERGRVRSEMYTTGKQVELLLHVTALILVEWILFQFLFRSPDGLPGRDMIAGKMKFLLIMVGVAVLWGIPLLFMLRHTRLTLRSCLVFVTVMACLMAGINYLAMFVPK